MLIFFNIHFIGEDTVILCTCTTSSEGCGDSEVATFPMTALGTSCVLLTCVTENHSDKCAARCQHAHGPPCSDSSGLLPFQP